jgi:hypothetical protein
MGINRTPKLQEDQISQVRYLDRWVSRTYFRAFVYNETGKKLANSYEEFIKLTSSGIWFETKEAFLKHQIDENEKNIQKDLLKESEEESILDSEKETIASDEPMQSEPKNSAKESNRKRKS